MLVKLEWSSLRQTRWYEAVLRFIQGGAITVLAGLSAKEFGPLAGGLFLAFPAIFPATATLIEKHEQEKKQKKGMNGVKRGRLAAAVDAAGAAMGTIGLMVFALTVWKLLPRMSLALTLTIATVAWAGTALIVWTAQRWRRRMAVRV